MTPAERLEALEIREANAALLTAKLERDRAGLESDIAASAAASKAASAITRALESDAAKRTKALEDECALLEGKLAKLKAEIGSATTSAQAAGLIRSDQEVAADKAAVAAARAQLAADRAAFDAERSSFERESAAIQTKHRAETQSLGDLRTKLGAIRNDIESSVKLREAEVHKKEVYLDGERNKLQAAADSLMRAESQFSEQRAKMEAQMAALASKEAMYEERHRQLQENMKHFVKA